MEKTSSNSHRRRRDFEMDDHRRYSQQQLLLRADRRRPRTRTDSGTGRILLLSAVTALLLSQPQSCYSFCTSRLLVPVPKQQRQLKADCRISQKLPLFVSLEESTDNRNSITSSSSSNSNSNSNNNNNNNSSINANNRNDIKTTKTLERSIVELGRKGLTDEALKLYYDCLDDEKDILEQPCTPKPTVRLMNGAIDACARAKPPRLQEAFDILYNAPSTIQPNVFTFGALMSACARARRGDKAKALLKTMQKDYNVMPNNVVYSSAITAVARSNPPQPQTALALLKEATDEHNLVMNVVGYNAVIGACASAGDWQRAATVLSEMTSSFSTCQPDHVTYGTVLAACEKGEQWKLVLEYAQQMEQLSIKFDTLALTSVLKACQQLGYAKEALYYLELMKQQQQKLQQSATTTIDPYARKTSGWKRKGAKLPLQGPDAVSYRLAISACARGGAWKEGIHLLEDFAASTGQPPDVMAFTAAITGCEYAGEWKHAFKLLDKMRKSGVDPNEVTMAAVIGACAAACQKEKHGSIAFSGTMNAPMPLPQHKALQLLNILKRDNSVVSPNINVYNAAIHVCAEACDLPRALQLMKDLHSEGLTPTIVTYGTLMTAAERVGSVEGANAVFRAMREQNMEPNEIIYGAAISCCRKAGQAERASLLLRKVIRDGLKPNVATFNTAIVAQVEGYPVDQCLDRAILIYRIMMSNKFKGTRPNRQTYNLLIRALSSAKKAREAHALLRKMSAAGYVPDVDLYAATVTAYERTGQPLQALRLMESMREDGYDFYDIDVLNRAFKKAVKLVNQVGRGFSSTGEGDPVMPSLKKLEAEQVCNDDDVPDATEI